MVNQRMIQDVQNETLDVDSVDPDPLKQFRKWFEDAHRAEIYQPEAMHLATKDQDGAPTGRYVLYKDPEKYGLDIDGFLFFTNLNSPKAVDIQKSSQIALTFYWKEVLRQIRIKGTAERAPDEISDKYFEIRPDASKLGAWASSQSEVIDSRAVLEEKVEYYRKKFEGKPIPRPKAWGGFVVRPNHLEFWQHRDDRLHDRVRYTLGEDGAWTIQRLSP